jgi:hypothetical protein
MSYVVRNALSAERFTQAPARISRFSSQKAQFKDDHRQLKIFRYKARSCSITNFSIAPEARGDVFHSGGRQFASQSHRLSLESQTPVH